MHRLSKLVKTQCMAHFFALLRKLLGQRVVKGRENNEFAPICRSVLASSSHLSNSGCIFCGMGAMGFASLSAV